MAWCCTSPKVSIDIRKVMEMAETDTNYFMADQAFYNDPFRYLDEIRSRSAVYREPHYGVYMVTGLGDCLKVWRDEEHYSSVNTVSGPFLEWPQPLEGDDLSEQIDRHRLQLGPRNNQLVTLDGTVHESVRALVAILFTPARLKKVEDFIGDYASQLIDRMVAQGELEVYNGPAREMTFYVIISLLGIPMDEAHKLLERTEANAQTMGRIGQPDGTGGVAAGNIGFGQSYEYFVEQVKAVRENPSEGILNTLATSTFRDGTLPSPEYIANICTVLFGAGQESTARMITHCLRYIAEDPALQDELRSDPSKLTNFIEEVLRYESPSKGTFRLAKKNTTLAGVDIPAGSTLCLLRIAANRDPEVFPDPHTLDPARANARQHVAFGGGVHMCIGQSLARMEINKFLRICLEKTSHISLVPGKNTFDYDFSYQLRGLQHLYIKMTPRN